VQITSVESSSNENHIGLGSFKSANAELSMEYTTGDRLKYTGISGIYRTVFTDIPTGSETITFNFVACTDADNNNYPVVKIGNQTWMAENLKTAKYRNGELIGTTTPDTLDIRDEIEPKYQWAYKGNESNVPVYGRLYTWYAAVDTQNVCPVGWHVPSDEEWSTLEIYLENNGYNFKGIPTADTIRVRDYDIAKSLAATTTWQYFIIYGGVGYTDFSAKRNATGFSALPGGEKYSSGSFNFINLHGVWWSNTVSSQTDAWVRVMARHHSEVFKFSYRKRAAYSIRCINDL
jgi:uncharacterized protein (TIGR02145 family)